MLLLKLLAVTMGASGSTHEEEGPKQPHLGTTVQPHLPDSHCLHLPPAALVPFLQPFGCQSKLCSQRFQNLGTVSLVASPVPSAKMIQILSVAQRPPRSPHAPRVRPQLAL